MAGVAREDWYTLRFEILARDNFTCRYCGQFAPNVMLEVDHVVATCDGGTDDPENLVAACRACNRGKEGLRARLHGRVGKRTRRIAVVPRPRIADRLAELLSKPMDIFALADQSGIPAGTVKAVLCGAPDRFARIKQSGGGRGQRTLWGKVSA